MIKNNAKELKRKINLKITRTQSVVVYKMKTLAGKLSEDDKGKLNSAVDAALSWLDTHQGATKEEYEAEKKKLENIAMPIMSKLAGQAGPGTGGPFPGAGAGGPFPGAGGPNSPPGYGGGPTVDEVD